MAEEKIRKLLLAALARGNDHDAAARLNGATPEQWQEVVRMAHQHDVEALLHWRLETLCVAERVPQDIRQGLRIAYLQSADRNMRLYHHLAELLGAFHHEGIAVIPLKGAYLAERIYGNIAVRPMRDVDLLLRKTDLQAAGKIMGEMGFNGKARAFGLEKVREQHHFLFYLGRHDLHVEIHWDLFSPDFGINADIDALFERSRERLVGGVPAHEMTAEDQVLHLCGHAAFHEFDFGVCALCDIAETLRYHQKTLDWDHLRQRSLQWGAQRCMYVSLYLAKELLNAPVPMDWPELIKPQDFEPCYLTLAHERVLKMAEERDADLPSASMVVQLRSAKGFMAKAILFWQRIFLPRNEMAILYPAPPHSMRILLYYPVRWKELLQRNCRPVWLLVRRDGRMASHVERQSQVNALKRWLSPARQT